MPLQRTRYTDYVQIFLPTKNNLGDHLDPQKVQHWRVRVEEVFRSHVPGFYVSPYYTIQGNFRSTEGSWIQEHNYVIKTYAPKGACQSLIQALEEEIIEAMGVALRQESIGVESSIEGLVLYEIQP